MPIEQNNTDGMLSLSAGLPTGAFTILGWFKLVNLNNAYRGIITFNNSAQTQYTGIWLNQSGGSGGAVAYFNSDGGTSLGTIVEDEWFGAVVSFTPNGASAVRLLREGTLTFQSDTFTGSNYSPDDIWLMGSTFSEDMLGDGAYFKIFEVALTEAEAFRELLHIRPVTNLSALFGWYPAWNASDAISGNLRDYSGNGNNFVPDSALANIDNTLGNNIPRFVSYFGPQLSRPPIFVGSVGGVIPPLYHHYRMMKR